MGSWLVVQGGHGARASLSSVCASSFALSGRFQISMNEAALVSAVSRFFPSQCTRATTFAGTAAGGAAAFGLAVSFFSDDSDFLQPDPRATAAARRPKPKDLRNIEGR